MIATETRLAGVLVITPSRFGDHRGFFSESFNKQRFEDIGISDDFVQDNHSLSVTVGTVRGLHFQVPPHAQAKLVRCGRGAIFDVAVDIRRGSPTYGHWSGCALSADNGRQMYVPEGFAHGFVTLEPDSEIIYKCSNYYDPASEGSLRWDDPDVGIEWPMSGEPILSEKDVAAPLLADFASPFIWESHP